MKFLRLLYELNPLRTAEKFTRFTEGQKMTRRFKNKIANIPQPKFEIDLSFKDDTHG